MRAWDPEKPHATGEFPIMVQNYNHVLLHFPCNCGQAGRQAGRQTKIQCFKNHIWPPIYK